MSEDPRSEFDALVAEAWQALSHAIADDNPGAVWAAHRAVNRAMLLLDTYRWDAK